MNHGETNTRDEGVVDAYRAASDALDERPSAESRATILAAAARAVEAQPQDVATGATARRQARPRARISALGPSRRPLAMVATFLVATVALVLATQTEEQHQLQSEMAMNSSSSPAAGGKGADVQSKDASAQDKDAQGKRETVMLPPPQVATAESKPIDKVTAPARITPPAAQAPAPARSPAEKQAAKPIAPARDEVAKADAALPSTAEAERAQMAARAPEAPGQTAASGAVAAGAPAAPPREERAKESLAANQQAPMARMDRHAVTEPDAPAAGKLAKARPVERTTAVAADVAVEADPARWMERVIALRDAGRDADADRELARLRERYPDMKVPPNALRRTGTQ